MKQYFVFLFLICMVELPAFLHGDSFAFDLIEHCNSFKQVGEGEFLYPVATLENKNQVWFVYQKSLRHLELWVWDSKKNCASKGLPTTFVPAGLQLLPSGAGFSFIDNGRIRIKLFEKRSPRSLELSEPLYDINTISWVDDHCFYLSAKRGRDYGLYQANDQGDVATICAQKNSDCMYPQKVGDQLFFIERSKEHGVLSYRIAQIAYPCVSYSTDHAFNDVDKFHERVAALIREDGQKKVGDCDDIVTYLCDAREYPMIFLYMTGPNEGFFVEHQAEIDDDHETMIPFSYYQLKKESEVWFCRQLFSFSIPTDLLFGEGRLHESLLPLLPYHYGQSIYFSSVQQGGELALFEFSLESGQEKKISPNRNNYHFFAPRMVDDSIICGYSPK